MENSFNLDSSLSLIPTVNPLASLLCLFYKIHSEPLCSLSSFFSNPTVIQTTITLALATEIACCLSLSSLLQLSPGREEKDQRSQVIHPISQCLAGTQSFPLYLTFCHPHGWYRWSGSSVHEILLARILEEVAMPSSRGSSQPRDQIHVF